MKTNQKSNLTLNVVIGILLFAMLGVILFFFINARINGANNEGSPLNIEGSSLSDAVSIKTTDGSILEGCKLTINNKYSTRVETINSENGTYLFVDFKDENNTRFDSSKSKPTSLFVNNCSNRPNDYASFSL